jgi:hypothetical protein
MKKVLLLVFALLLFSSRTPAQGIRNFTDDDLKKVLGKESRVLFYSFSPSMPLSVEGLKEVRRAAEALDATLVVLADPAAHPSEILSLGDPEIRYQKSGRLRDQGIQLHYPSVVVSNNHKVVGPPIEGYKTHAGYVTLVSDLLKLSWKEEFQLSEQVDLPRRMNPFFKPMYGTDLVVSGSAGSFLFNLRTKSAIDLVDTGDPGPSPDGKFVTLLNGVGLFWYSTADILAGDNRILLLDPGLRTYQSLGQLSSSRYRVLGSISSSTNPAGLIVRDYESSARSDGGKMITALAEWRRVCDGKQISIPMMSKTGELLSGSHEGTLRVFRLGADASRCDEVFDARVVTGKADFSRDDRFLTYVTRLENPVTRMMVDTVILADLQKGTSTPIHYGDTTAQLAFPGFMSPDRIVVYDQTSRKFLVVDRTRTIQ